MKWWDGLTKHSSGEIFNTIYHNKYPFSLPFFRIQGIRVRQSTFWPSWWPHVWRDAWRMSPFWQTSLWKILDTFSHFIPTLRLQWAVPARLSSSPLLWTVTCETLDAKWAQKQAAESLKSTRHVLTVLDHLQKGHDGARRSDRWRHYQEP